MPNCIDKLEESNVKDLILKCIHEDPKKRPSIIEILKHNFFIDDSKDDDIVNNEIKIFDNEDTKSEEIINNFREKEEILRKKL